LLSLTVFIISFVFCFVNNYFKLCKYFFRTFSKMFLCILLCCF
jgi:hypothetical protein